MNGRIVRITKLVAEDGTTYMATETGEVTNVQAVAVGVSTAGAPLCGDDAAPSGGVASVIDAVDASIEVTFTDREGTACGFYATMRTNNREVLKRAQVR